MAIVKIIIDDDGAPTANDDWHLVDPCNMQGEAALCTQEFFGQGESTAVFERKDRGKVTCLTCRKIIAIYKRVNLETSIS